MMDRKVAAIVVCLLLFSIMAHAADERRPWSTVEFKVGNLDDKTSVRLESDGVRLTKAILAWQGKTYEIPDAELKDIIAPQLDTADLLFYWGDNYSVRCAYIELRFGAKPFYGEFSKVDFLFHSGKYQDRTITVKTSDTTWQDFQKLPGEDMRKTGTITQLSPPKAGTEPSVGGDGKPAPQP